MTCGSEHTVALTLEDKVYSWGQGEGGLLGHGNTVSQWSPRKIEALDLYAVSSVICGGLHTLAITRQGHVYTWGRAEGGQLGVPIDQMIHDPSTNELYLTTPKRIRGALDGQFVTQVACGDAHSLALTNLNQVYGWGYTNSGQLGLGVNQDNFEPGVSRYNLQVLEPVLIERLRAAKIVKIYAGSTFSLFMNEHQEVALPSITRSNPFTSCLDAVLMILVNLVLKKLSQKLYIQVKRRYSPYMYLLTVFR